MKSHVCSIALWLLLGSLGLAATANAQQQGLYVGGYYGQASKDAHIADYDAFAFREYDSYGFTALQSDATLDKRDSSYGFVVGYRFTPHWAVESGYMDLGNVAYRNASSGTYQGLAETWRLHLDSQTTAFALSGLAILPVNYRVEIYGRAAVLFATNEFTYYITDGVDSLHYKDANSSTDLLAGIGASMSFAEIYGVRVEYQRVFDAGSQSTGEGDVDMLSLGVTVYF
jgi:hypothetical protein